MEDIHASPSHPDSTSEGSSNAPPLEATQLWEEVNKALECLLAMRSTINAHRKKEISDFGMALHLNESKVTKAVKTVKALCVCTGREVEALCVRTIREADAHCMALVSEAETHHVAFIKEGEANHASALAEAVDHCSIAIREAESWGASQDHSI